ncbi:MAG: hypothetical protein JXA33_07900 [Anaerolineae bacterium]|nr:hypothetical protein [Anaerolineae bacterium]
MKMASFDAYVQDFKTLFGSGTRATRTFSGFVGRVLRGTRPEHFTTLSDDPQRRVVFLLDAGGLTDLIGQSGRDILRYIGYPEAFINTLLAQGTIFKLVILPQIQASVATMLAQPATWDHLLDLVSAAYPEWCARIAQTRETLKTLPYTQIMAGAGIAKEVRIFLERDLNVNPLFAGDGYTRSEGKPDIPGCAEYVLLNRPLTAFEKYILIDLPVGKHE